MFQEHLPTLAHASVRVTDAGSLDSRRSVRYASSSSFRLFRTVFQLSSETAFVSSYVVLRLVGTDRWQVVGEVERKPGLTARNARAQAIKDATGGKAKAGQVYRAVLRSE